MVTCRPPRRPGEPVELVDRRAEPGTVPSVGSSRQELAVGSVQLDRVAADPGLELGGGA